jgi:TonB family protein
MFDPLQPKRRKRNPSQFVSFAIHGAIILAVLSRAPMFVRPSSVAWGMRGQSEEIVYFAQNAGPESSAQKLVLPRKPKRQASKEQKQKTEALRAGVETGSLDRGPANGSEAAPALPLIFPDPVIYPWQVANLQGDVVVEVTIDAQGNVADTRVLQSLKQEIDEKVVATLKGWRFKPAMLDGMAIASRQDVHFHFPS